jgi:peptide/nickel transport system substrate-binding protein
LVKWCRVKRSSCLPAFLAAVVAVSPFLGGAAPARATTIPHVLRFATAEEIATLNPDLNQQLVVAWLSEMTAAYLFRLDHRNALEPELATEVPTQSNGGVSRDGKTVTVHLRRGLKWSDGAPLDADDIVFSIAAENNAANNIVDRSGFDHIAKIDEPNKQTVIVHLKVPIGAIVYRLFASNQTSSAILPKHLLGSLPDINTAPFNALPIGAGPFRYKAWERGDRVELEPNPFYWRGRPSLSEVVMKLIPDRNTVLTQLQTGELDMWYPFGGAYLSRVQSIPNVHVIRQPSYANNLVLFNTTAPALKDRTVREALRFAVDRRTLRDKVSHGVGNLQNVLLPEVDPAVPKNIAFTPFDLAKANALLDAGGWKRGDDGVRSKDGVRLSIDFASSQGTPDADTAIELIRASWKEIGVEINVQRYQSSVLFGPYAAGGILATGKFGVLFLGNVVPAPFDLENEYGCSGFPPKGQNYNRFCYPPLEPLIADYARSFDSKQRAAKLSKVLHLLDDQAISIVTVGREDLFGVSDAVKNFHPNNATPFDDMMHVDVVP